MPISFSSSCFSATSASPSMPCSGGQCQPTAPPPIESRGWLTYKSLAILPQIQTRYKLCAFFRGPFSDYSSRQPRVFSRVVESGWSVLVGGRLGGRLGVCVYLGRRGHHAPLVLVVGVRICMIHGVAGEGHIVLRLGGHAALEVSLTQPRGVCQSPVCWTSFVDALTQTS